MTQAQAAESIAGGLTWALRAAWSLCWWDGFRTGVSVGLFAGLVVGLLLSAVQRGR